MKHWIIGVSLVLGVFFIAPAPAAHAWSRHSAFGTNSDSQVSDHRHRRTNARRWSYGKSQRSSSNSSVPELDPGAAGSAVVLLLGGVAYVLSRRREEEDVA